MSTKILLVEDNDYKRGRILDYISSEYPSVVVVEARSYTSGKEAIELQKFDLLLLDVSLPTYDKTPSEGDGRFRTFGGRELARKAIKAIDQVPILFITQYKSFSDKGSSYTFEELVSVLAKDCGASFKGAVFFDTSVSTWKESLSSVLDTSNNQ